jgi:Zn-dependent M28 family amino/carboxypeptidase
VRGLLPLLLLLSACATAPPPTTAERAERWWADVSVLAGDSMEGRQPGSEGFDRAQSYVVEQLQSIGLEPAGELGGFHQWVALEQQTIDAAASSASLVSGRTSTPLRIPADLIIGRGDGPRPERVDAPLVFIGYGLHMPEAGHDDFAGIDLKGKIAVFVSGGPEAVSGALKAHARRDRARLLEARGAAGMLSLTTPAAVEVPWSRSMAQASQPGMYFWDASINDVKRPFFIASFAPGESERLFARSGRSFAEVAALADASKPVPGFALNQSLRAVIASRYRVLDSSNIVARLPGRDPRLRDEHVVLSAHLDHLGIGEPIGGDGLYNGAMDNAAGVAALLDIAQSFKERGLQPKRSLLFVFVTAEEKGLLGSRYFALRPRVAKSSIVANLNLDMPLPIFPLTSVTALGAEESSLGADAAAVAAEMGLPLAPDAFPDRNAFTRSDQYSFIREGIPALAFKFGFARGTPESAAERAWRSTRYHSPSDDLAQPVEREDAVRLHDFVAAVALRVANAPERPHWLPESFFRRFAQ